eukprot:5096190-Amphidinium_carterae.1
MSISYRLKWDWGPAEKPLLLFSFSCSDSFTSTLNETSKGIMPATRCPHRKTKLQGQLLYPVTQEPKFREGTFHVLLHSYASLCQKQQIRDDSVLAPIWERKSPNSLPPRISQIESVPETLTKSTCRA